jgi:hypothetical protein
MAAHRTLAALVAAALSLLLAASPAAASSADAWRELVPYDVPGGGAASCLRDAGGGRLALLGSFGFGHAESDLLAVGDAGTAAVGATRFSRLLFCPEVAADASGDPLLAATALDHRRPDDLIEVRRVVAAAGGAPVHLAGGPVADLGPVRVAVAANGAAVVAWSERLPGRGRAMRVVAATRPSGDASFGPARALRAPGAEEVVTGIDAAGRTHVAWIARERLHVWSAEAGEPFARTLRSGRLVRTWEPPALAVASDGRALAVTGHRSGAAAWELSPGGRGFARASLPHVHGELFAVALEPGGSAAIVGFEAQLEIRIVHGDDPDGRAGGVAIARRLGSGRFGGVQTLPVEERQLGAGLLFAGDGGARSQPAEWRPRTLGVALSPTGQLAVAWTLQASAGRPAAVFAAHGTLAHGLGAPRRLGSECRAVGAVAPFLLADGRIAVAWTDHGGGAVVDGTELTPRAGRLHVAVPASAAGEAPAASAPAPSALEAEIASPALRPSGALQLRLRCSGGPCDVRARTAVRPNAIAKWLSSRAVGVSASASLAAGEETTLAVRPPTGWSFTRPGRRAPVHVSLTVCNADGAAARGARLTAPVRTQALPPAPRIAGLTAQLDGRAVVVAWRLTRPLPRGAGMHVGVGDHDGGTLRQGRPARTAGLRYRARIPLGRDLRAARFVTVLLVSDLVPRIAEARVAISGSRPERPRPDGLMPNPDAPPPPGRSSPSR